MRKNKMRDVNSRFANAADSKYKEMLYQKKTKKAVK